MKTVSKKNSIWVPVKNANALREAGIFLEPSKLRKWNHYNRYPGLFSKPNGGRDLFIDAARYAEIMEDSRIGEAA